LEDFSSMRRTAAGARSLSKRRRISAARWVSWHKRSFDPGAKTSVATR
jgi:hypothetical protein